MSASAGGFSVPASADIFHSVIMKSYEYSALYSTSYHTFNDLLAECEVQNYDR